MSQKKKIHPKIKSKLHPRNKHRGRYNFQELIESCPDLSPFVKLNEHQNESIDFFNPEAVKMLNKALLTHFYGIEGWDIPPNYLCPPIPGRADYIHHAADLLANHNRGIIPRGQKIKCLDIGMGANCIYPIIGNMEYGWSFTGTEIDPVAVKNAKKIINANPILKNKIEVRLQSNPENIFPGITKKDEYFDLTICNPPFHASLAEVRVAASRKVSNLKRRKTANPVPNFGGQNNELWYEGGEVEFVKNMVRQSKQVATSCFWFSTLVSKKSNLKIIYAALKNTEARKVTTIEMGQGNKISRIIAWTFLNKKQQTAWANFRWK